MKQALLVIDVQNEYFSGKLPVTYPPGSFINILQAMDAAHLVQIPVVLIQHSNHAPDAASFRYGTHGWELHPEVMKRPHDVLIEKTFPGSFTHTNLGSWLRNHTISSLTVSGYMTQMCCDTTARQAFHEGYGVTFLSDATGTRAVTNKAGAICDADLHKAVLVTQQMRFSNVMTTAEWIQSLHIEYQ